MQTGFARSADGTRVAYDVTGRGPAVLLLHGFTNTSRVVWHDQGWPARLGDAFTVIALDLRGCGRTDAYDDPARYGPAAHMADIDAVLDACGVERAMVWGFSWGATIARHLASHSDRITRAVMAGSFFGQIFTDAYVQPHIARLEELAAKKAAGQVDDLDDETRAFVEQTDLAVLLARWRGLQLWPAIEPGEVRCPMLVYTGTHDGNVVKVLETQRERILAAGIRLHVFDGLDHSGLVCATGVVEPLVRAFLAS